MVLEQLASKREELSQLYHHLERISGEQALQHKNARRPELALQTVQDQAQAEQITHQRDLEQLRSLPHQVIRLREKTKPQLIKQRHDLRQLRLLRENLENVASDLGLS